MKGKLCFRVRDHLRGIPHFVQGNQGFHRAQVSFESLFSHASPCLHRPRYLSLENRMLNPKPKTRRDPRMPDRFFMPSGGSSRLPQRLGTAGRSDMAGPGLTRGMHVELPKVNLMQPLTREVNSPHILPVKLQGHREYLHFEASFLICYPHGF